MNLLANKNDASNYIIDQIIKNQNENVYIIGSLEELKLHASILEAPRPSKIMGVPFPDFQTCQKLLEKTVDKELLQDVC